MFLNVDGFSILINNIPHLVYFAKDRADHWRRLVYHGRPAAEKPESAGCFLAHAYYYPGRRHRHQARGG